MNTHMKYLLRALIAISASSLLALGAVQAKVDGDTIILGSAISLTGKYATNGIHAKRGYDHLLRAAQGNEPGKTTAYTTDSRSPRIKQ